MNDFDNFDKRFNLIWRLTAFGAIATVAVGVGLLGFGIWVVIKIMAHYGII